MSHEWLSWAHPDPKGEQLYVLCRVMERLRAGEIDSVEMDMVMSMFYKWNFRTSAEEWKEMLERTYIWFDWLSMPQPSAEKANSKNIDRIRIEGSKAIRSIPAYVERCDFVMILAPTGYHSDRKVSTCYRTWRRRGWCLLELFASMMSRDQSNPALLVRSAESTPIYIAQMEVQKLSIGLADFTCCQRNHVIVTETQKILAKKDDDDDDDDDKKKKEEDEINEESSSSSSSNKIACDKPIAGRILKSLIRAKIYDLYNAKEDYTMGRLHYCCLDWWTRGMEDDEEKKEIIETIADFKNTLRWDELMDGKWYDREGISLLIYAVTASNHTLTKLRHFERKDLESRISNNRYTWIHDTTFNGNKCLEISNRDTASGTRSKTR